MPVKADPRGERGFSMVIVVVAMFVTSMFVAAALAASDSDFKLSFDNQERKVSYAAAEAGLEWYVKQLRGNPDFWAQCNHANTAPNAAERTPINQQWDGEGEDPRVWRKVAGKPAEYTIELLHTPQFSACDPNKQESLIDMNNGTFKVRVTGRAMKDRSVQRSIIGTFSRVGFLRFVYFTDQENRDPQAATSSSDRNSQQANCVGRNRTARTGRGCVEIQFASNDEINGPLHTNDESLLVCGTPKFGRQSLMSDLIEVNGPAPGYVHASGCSGTPPIYTPTGKITPNSEKMPMPDSNQELMTVAQTGGRVYRGKTVVRLKGTTMDVTNYETGSPVTTTNVPWPGNGVLYVVNNGACNNSDIPTDAKYNESAGCGNVYVSGTYAKSLTIAAANDVIVRPTLGGKLANKSADANITLTAGSDATLGLIANNFVRVGHKVNRGSSSCSNYSSVDEPTVGDVTIEAAIMSLQHSFIVDNYDCGLSGRLRVVGAIVQRFRGPVGTGSGGTITTGYTKDYWYDDRLRYRSPPYFLNPVKYRWEVIHVQEQVAGAPGS
jgi:hypothetical protein